MNDTENAVTAATALPLAALQPNDYNPNQMTDERFAELVEEATLEQSTAEDHTQSVGDQAEPEE